MGDGSETDCCRVRAFVYIYIYTPRSFFIRDVTYWTNGGVLYFRFCRDSPTTRTSPTDAGRPGIFIYRFGRVYRNAVSDTSACVR